MHTPIKLNIPAPCHENWNEMLPKDQGRFCGSCSKVVVDFSVMTDKQVLEYFSNYSGNTCGRFSNDQLNRTIDPQVRLAKGWFRYMLAAMLPAVFVAGKTYSQGKPAPMARDTSVVKNMGAAVKISAKDIEVPAPEVKKILLADSTGWEDLENMVAGGIGIEIDIAKEPVFHKFARLISDTLRGQSFNVYPNPARSSAALNISYNISKGDYFLQVLDANGRLMQQQAVHLSNNVNGLAFRLGVHYAKGQYLLLLSDNRRRKIGARQFMIIE